MPMGNTGLSSGPPIEQISPDLEAIYQGGQFFLDRMKAMGDARDYAKTALDALNLGKDIVATQAEAQALLDKAKAATTEAAKTVDDAKTAAARIVADAKVQAEGIITNAVNTAADTEAKSTAAKKKSDKQIADSTAQAEAALADVQAKQNDITRLTKAAQDALADAATTKAAADVATKAAAQSIKDAQKVYQEKLAKIQAAIG